MSMASKKNPSSLESKAEDDSAVLNCRRCRKQTRHNYNGAENLSDGTIIHKYRCIKCDNIYESNRRF